MAVRVRLEPELPAFRRAARGLLARGVEPRDVHFEEASETQGSLLEPGAPEAAPDGAPVQGVPSAFLLLAEAVACHREPARWALLYRVLWRLVRGGERALLEVDSDPDVHRLRMMEKAVSRDAHKMKAFVRFRRVERDGEEHFVAWHRPDHRVLRRVAPFFAQRFPSMRWSVLTPDASAHWDLERLSFGPGVPRSEAPEGDVLEELWAGYYAPTFNPARLNLRAMRAEMPKKHWATLPEARLIPALTRAAGARVERMVRPEVVPSAASPFVPAGAGLAALAEAARGCTACPLHARASTTVFGEGPQDAAVMLVGEQPGDTEDRAGRPFVGPAGQVLDEVLRRVGLARERLYVTNAVKHFGWREAGPGDGPQRLHAKPGRAEVLACNAWLQAEVEAVRPRFVLALGATAAQAFLGPGFRLALSRGQVFQTPQAPWWMATFHPSALLRMPDARAREQARAHFEQDLRALAEAVRG